jgi:ankyrin repeat protein
MGAGRLLITAMALSATFTLEDYQPMFNAAREGDIAEIERQLERGLLIDGWSNGTTGQSALCIAAQDGNLELVQDLVALGADMRLGRSRFGDGPLHFAADKGHLPVVGWLIAKGVHPDETSGGNVTPLARAAASNQLETMRYLLRKGAAVDGGSSPYQPLAGAAGAGHLGAVKLLMDHGSNPNLRFEAACSPSIALTQAAWNGHLDIVHYLVRNGAEVDSQSEKQRTALGRAAMKNHHDVITFLLANGADVDGGRRTYSPLGYAVNYGNADTVALLLKNGADPNRACGRSQQTPQPPLAWALKREVPAIIDLLRDAGAREVTVPGAAVTEVAYAD